MDEKLRVRLVDPDFIVTLLPSNEGPLGSWVEPPVIAFKSVGLEFRPWGKNDPCVHLAATVEAAEARVVSEATLVQDRPKIERAVREEILMATQFPLLRWEGEMRPSEIGTPGAVRFEGQLEIRGRRVPAGLTFLAKPDGFWHAESTVRQTEFGIEPATAMLGSLRSSDRFRFHVRVNPSRLQALWADAPLALKSMGSL